MSANAIIQSLSKQGIQLFLKEGKLKARAQKGKILAEHKSLIGEHREQLVDYLANEEPEVFTGSIRPNIEVIEDRLPGVLSFAQQRLWFIHQLQGSSAEYNMPISYRIDGEFDVDMAEEALAEIVARHEVLRTVYISEGEEVLQKVLDSARFTLSRSDLSGLSEAEMQVQLRNLIETDAVAQFDLSHDLMFRGSYIYLGGTGAQQRGVLLLNMHHIASDGWSLSVLTREFSQLYSAAVQGRSAQLPALPIQYRDYARWQRDWLQGEVLNRQLDYWQSQLTGMSPVHSLPLRTQRPAVKQHAGEKISDSLPASLSRGLQGLAQAYQLTPFMLLHAALAIVLSRHSGNHDVILGTPVANRPQSELESMIGFFVNTLVLRVDTRASTFGEYLQQVREVNLGAQANQDVPFEQLVEHLKIPRSQSYAPLFQIMLTTNSDFGVDPSSSNALSGLGLQSMPRKQVTAKFDLDVDIQLNRNGVVVNWVYDKALFEQSYVQQLNNHFCQLLTQLSHWDASCRERPLNELEMLSAAERQHLITGVNPGPSDFPRELLLHEVFENQVQRVPDATAVTYRSEQLTFEQLNSRANQLAQRLRSDGVTDDSLVALCLPRGLDMVVSILAVLKAGGAYVPVETSLPVERIKYVLSDTQTQQLITDTGTLHKLGDVPVKSVFCLDEKEIKIALSQQPGSNLPRLSQQNSDSLAWVIYTSGSTGQPKGVMLAHKGANNLAVELQTLQLGQNKAWGWVAPYGFDASVQGLLAMFHGQKLVIVDNETKMDIAALRELITQQNIGVLDCSPGVLGHWLSEENGDYLPDLIVGGEAIPVDMWQQLVLLQQQNGSRVFNVYGPTECTVDSSIQRIEGDEPSIGRALANVGLYVMDGNRALVPKGAEGELYISGVGLARGYLNRPELTKQRFIDDLLITGQRLYRTGDMVRWSADDTLVYLGRSDDQVKLRGFRIELGEIENQLTTIEEVTSAAVLLREDKPGLKRLVAYVASSAEPETLVTRIKARLEACLPEYMQPSAILVLPKLPLTNNGKLDKKALPSPEDNKSEKQFVAPQTETEKALAAIWAELLQSAVQNISRQQNFFESGGHSLLLIRLAAQLRARLGVEVPVAELFENSDLQRQAKLVDSSRENAIRPAIVPQNLTRGALSFAQKRLWLIDQMQGGSPEYNMLMTWRISGEFDVTIAQQVLSDIVARHQILRTIYVEDGDEVQQCVVDDVCFTLSHVNLLQLPEEQQSAQIQEIIDTEATKPFDLSRDLMICGTYIDIASDDSKQQGVLLLNLHHIAADGWSVALMMNEFRQGYSAVITDAPAQRQDLKVQYLDYALWQRDWLQGEVLDNQLNYWRSRLAGIEPLHNLPLKGPRPLIKGHDGAAINGRLSPEVSQGLLALAKAYQLTPFMLIHAALALLLARHSGSCDVVIGTPVANRTQAELGALIGFFVNTLVLRVDTQNASLADYLKQVKEVHMGAQAHQDVPFEQLLESLQVKRSQSHSPLFQIMLTTNSQYGSDHSDSEEHLSEQAASATSTVLESSKLAIEPMSKQAVKAKFDLDIAISLSEEGGSLHWVFDTQLFSDTYIEQLNRHMVQLLHELSRCTIEQQNICISKLEILPQAERGYLLSTLNGEVQQYPEQALIHELFEDQVKLRPTALALVCEKERLSYAQLNLKANQLAHSLRDMGVGPESLVALCLPRGVDMVVSLMAVLKAGGAYVPIDPSNPASRINFMLGDCKAPFLLTQRNIAETLQVAPECQVYCLDDEGYQSVLSAQLESDLPRLKRQNNRNLAYVIYTSGSTGKPKGTELEHRGLCNLVRQQVDMFDISYQSRVMQLASFGFDAATMDWSLALCSGASLYIVPKEIQLDTRLLTEYVKQHGITYSLISASLLSNLNAEDFSSMELVATGGEAIPFDVARRWAQHCRFVNAYGPTECTVVATAEEVFKDSKELCIGKPLPNLGCLVLDEQQRLQPKGIAGELYLSGVGLARGYLNNPELTKQKFVPHPFSTGETLYSTGDIVRWNDEDKLVFLGRRDEQVKLRGFRIELGEIENQIATFSGVNSAVVMLREDTPGQKLLVAYVVTQEQSEAQFVKQLKQHLQTALPDYMVPGAFVCLESFPVTPNGKVDKKALPVPDETGLSDEFSAPQTGSEKRLAGIWAKVLQKDEASLSRHHNFFELGGHSLLLVRLATQIKTQLHVEVSVSHLFAAITLEGQARLIDSLQSQPADSGYAQPDIIASQSRAGESALSPLSFAQQRLWFIHQMQGSSSEYNMPMAFRISGNIDVEVVERTLAEIILRHEVLRTVYVNREDGVFQQVLSNPECKLQRIDISDQLASDQQKEIAKAMLEESRHCFDLNRDLMIRGRFIALGTEDGVPQAILMLNMHHIASDGWSVAVLMNEFRSLYYSISTGTEIQLPELTIQYRDYAHWQRDWLQGEVLDRQLQYWQKQLSGISPVHSLPLKGKRLAVKGHSGAMVSGRLSDSVANRLKAFAKAHQLTPFMLFHAAASLVLARHSQGTDVVVGTPVANRTQSKLEPLIGFFVNTLVLRLDTSDQSLSEYLQQVRNVNLDAQAFQDVPFEQLVEHMQVSRSQSYSPLFQIMVTTDTDYGMTSDDTAVMSDVAIEPLSQKQVSAKFDLDIDVSFKEGGVELTWVYDTALFAESYIQRLNQHLSHLLTLLSQQDTVAEQVRLSDLEILPPQERQYLLATLNDTKTEFSNGELIHQAFEEQAGIRPEATALVFENQRMTYAELNQRANRLAHELRSAGVGCETLVAICLPRCPDILVAILAVLKAGGAYVPVDPSYPDSRIDYMLADSKTSYLICNSSTNNLLKNATYDQKWCLDDEHTKSRLLTKPESNPPLLPEQSASNLAYVMYTSGSTGKPKGVMIEHGNLQAFANSAEQHYGLCPEDVALQFASMSFDSFVEEFLLSLRRGAILVLRDERCISDPQYFWDFIAQHGVTFVSLPTAFWHVLCTEINVDSVPDTAALHTVVLGGEALNGKVQAKWNALKKRHIKVFNTYGPSESTVIATACQVDDFSDETGQPSIGKPIANTQCYILDELAQLCPEGVEGELYLAGDSLARGYFNKPELTQQRFLTVDLPDVGAKRLYKTGDKVQYLASGELAFRGRTDDQIKLRGFRIELGEIQNQISAVNGVESAFVNVYSASETEQQLIAYAVADEAEGEHLVTRIKQHLKQSLPPYMRPAHVIVLSELPLNTNGKVDKAALPPPQLLQVELVDAREMTGTERRVKQLWSELLKVEKESISTSANFFDLGGHSLLGIRFTKLMLERFNVTVSFADLLNNQTVEELAQCIDAKLLEQDKELVCDWGLQALPQNSASVEKNIIHLQKGDAKLAPLILLHPIGGGVSCYLDLVRELQFEGNIYGIESIACDTSLQQRVGFYLEGLQRLCIPDEVYVAGWSLGGIFAYELAQQLKKYDIKVKKLILIDSLNPVLAEKRSVDPQYQQELMAVLLSEMGVDLSLVKTDVEKSTRLDAEKLIMSAVEIGRQQNVFDDSVNADEIRVRLEILAQNDQLCLDYVPEPYQGEVVLFKSQDASVKSNSLGWGELTSITKIEHINANHFSMVKKPAVTKLANKILSHFSD